MEQNTVSRAYTIQDRAGKPGGGKGFLIQDNICGTLGTSCGGDRAVIMVMKNENNPVAYGICSMDSNSMKSSNPHSGFYEAETSRTLDLNGGNPGCNQGGVIIVMKQRVSTAIDLYNMTETGGVTKTLNSAASDSDHVPCVVIPIEGNGARQSHQGKGYGEVGGGNVHSQHNRNSCHSDRKEDRQWNQ